MNLGLAERDLKFLYQAIKEFPEIEEVIMFGSRAKGNFKEGSDVDLAIKGINITSSTVLRLSYKLNEELPIPFFFDIVDYRKISNPELIEHINRVGKIIYPE